MFKFVSKLFSLLDRAERRELYWLLATMVVLAVIEVASVGSIMPFMTVVTNPDIINENDLVRQVYETLHFESTNSFLLALGIIVFITLIVSNSSTAVITWWIFGYSWNRNHSIARRLFSKYLSEPYVFFLNRNTSELEKNILDEIQLVIIGILNSMLMILKNSVVILFVVLLLFATDPLLAVIVSTTLGGAYFALFRVSSRMLRRIGRERADANVKRFKYVSEALSGIKVLRVLGREGYFLDSFSEHSLKVSTNFAKKSVIAQVPRYAFEIIAFGGVLLIILYFLAMGRNVEQVVPVLSLYAFAGYRLMPAMQTVFNKAANIRYVIPSLEIIYKDLCSTGKESSEEYTEDYGNSEGELRMEQKGVQFKNIDFSYPGQENNVIENLNLLIPVRKTVGFAGQTGSGKTTIIDILLGLLRPTAGSMYVDNSPINSQNIRKWQKKIGYVPQDIFLTDESVTHNIAFGVPEADIDQEAVVRAAKVANLHTFIIEELPDAYDTIVGERGVRISGGQKQRIGIARALYHDPEVLILDEATSALDGVTEETIMQAIHSLSHKKTIIMIAHRLTTLQECDEINVLDHGKIVAKGTYTELLESSQYFQSIKDTEKMA